MCVIHRLNIVLIKKLTYLRLIILRDSNNRVDNTEQNGVRDSERYRLIEVGQRVSMIV